MKNDSHKKEPEAERIERENGTEVSREETWFCAAETINKPRRKKSFFAVSVESLS